MVITFFLDHINLLEKKSFEKIVWENIQILLLKYPEYFFTE